MELIDDRAAAIAQINVSFTKRIEGLKAALEADQGGFVFCWEKYGLGVRIENGLPRTVGVEDATITTRNDRRSFRNGGNERAVLITRRTALKAALAYVSESFANIEAYIAKSSAAYGQYEI